MKYFCMYELWHGTFIGIRSDKQWMNLICDIQYEASAEVWKFEEKDRNIIIVQHDRTWWLSEVELRAKRKMATIKNSPSLDIVDDFFLFS